METDRAASNEPDLEGPPLAAPQKALGELPKQFHTSYLTLLDAYAIHIYIYIYYLYYLICFASRGLVASLPRAATTTTDNNDNDNNTNSTIH